MLSFWDIMTHRIVSYVWHIQTATAILRFGSNKEQSSWAVLLFWLTIPKNVTFTDHFPLLDFVHVWVLHLRKHMTVTCCFAQIGCLFSRGCLHLMTRSQLREDISCTEKSQRSASSAALILIWISIISHTAFHHSESAPKKLKNLWNNAEFTSLMWHTKNHHFKHIITY